MNPLPTFRFRPPVTWAWLPLVLWHGGFLGGPAGAVGAALGWSLGAYAGDRGASRVSRSMAAWLGPVLAGLAQLSAFPLAHLATVPLAAAWPAAAAADVLFLHAVVTFGGTGLWLGGWSRAWPRLGFGMETVTGLLFALAPLAAHRGGGLTYPYWLTDGFSARGWAVHAGYFAAGAGFLGCLVLRATALPEPPSHDRHRKWVGPALALLLVLPTTWFVFGQARLPLASSPPPANLPPPPGSGPDAPPSESPQDAPPPPEDDRSYDALVRFRGLPPRSPVQWGGHFFRIESGLPDIAASPEPGQAVADVYLFDDSLEGPPVHPAPVSGEPFSPPPGVRRAFRTVSRIPDRGYDPELFPFYRMADDIARVPPEALPSDWEWLGAVLLTEDDTRPDETIAAVAKWLRANVIVGPKTLTPTGEQLAARALPVRAEAPACLEIAVRLLRSRGIAARIADGYLVPFPERGQPPSDVLLLGSMRTSWLEVDLGRHGWQPLPLALPGPPTVARTEPDPELLQHVLELLRRESPAERPRPLPGVPWPWFLVLPAIWLVWRVGVTWRELWGVPMDPGPVPAAGAVARALELLAATGLGQRGFGESCTDFASRLEHTAPALGSPLLRLADLLEADYAALPSEAPPRRSPSPAVHAAYGSLLAALLRRRPAFLLRFLLPGPVFRRNEPQLLSPPWTPPTP